MCEYFSYLGSKVRRNAVVAGVALCLMPAAAMAQPAAPSMGGAESFAVLAGATVANTGTATIGGDVGVDAGGTVSGITAAMLAEEVPCTSATPWQFRHTTPPCWPTRTWPAGPALRVGPTT